MNKFMLKKTDYSLFLVVGLLSITIINGIICSSVYVNADDVTDVVDNVNLTVPVSCSYRSGGGTYNETMAGGTVKEITANAITTSCNDAAGYAIYAIGFSNNKYTSDTTGNNNDMITSLGSSHNITTSSNNTYGSNWKMKLTSPVDATIESAFNNTYTAIPSTYTKVASYNTNTTGGSITPKYQITTGSSQPAGTYTGKVKYTLVHPATEIPAQPQPTTAGYINYYANTNTAVGTMGRQSASDGNTVTLYASNFSRDGYGFIGWSDAYDYATNANAHFYGPNEDITVPTGTTANGLALYAVWVKSAGTMQSNGASVCNSLTAATYNDEGDADESTWSIVADLSSISALTDARDGNTYAIAKLTDGKCWMIENLRLDNTPELTSANTNNPSLPLTNVYDTSSISNHLSPTSSVAYNASTAPEGWCSENSATCDDQSRIRTDNTANRTTYTTTQNMSTSANLYSYGNYYNWYSATAGNGKYANGSGYTAPGDICPTGWHLPTGIGSGEFGLLNNSLGGYKDASNVAQHMSNSTTPTGAIASQRLRHFPVNLLYSGLVSGTLIGNRSVNGGFWSSLSTSNNSAYLLSLDSSSVRPGTVVYNKYYGSPVRCITTTTP